ncbi:MAG: CheR family methyltransferase [Chloroflexota bacterium]
MSSEEPIDEAFERLLKYLKQNRGFDFTDYKRASLMRRIRKRMGMVGVTDFTAYEDYLDVHPKEFGELFNTILINVTSFFRDKPAWDYLAEVVVPRILQDKSPGAALRVWSAGCASGEEAYSIAMLLAEAMGMDAYYHQVKIYATDVDEDDLERARRGTYSAEAIQDLPEALRQKYFSNSLHNNRYVFQHDLRRTLIFGRHDLMHDAPISRLDLLICRNTLIYFNAEAQERIMARFYFALKDTGYLFLGRAETMLSHSKLFESVDIRNRIFGKLQKREGQKYTKGLMLAGDELAAPPSDNHMQLMQAAFETDATPQIVVDPYGNLVLANEAARCNLGLDRRDLGRPFHDLELSYRPLELRSLIDRTRQERRTILTQDVMRILPDVEGEEYLDVLVTPLWDSGSQWLGASICFRNATERHDLKTELEQMRHDLETTYEELQSTNEELETSNEELQSTVEELQTTNEELQSSNEEMETMNEELQSVNNDLQAMNDDLRERTYALDQANSFLQSILSSLNVGVVAVDRNFVISMWNDRAEDLWGLYAAEVLGQSLLDLDIGLPVGALEEPLARFFAGKAKNEDVVLDAVNRRGRAIRCHITYTLRRNCGGEVEGVVLLMEEER